jgi:hypothetical protein
MKTLGEAVENCGGQRFFMAMGAGMVHTAMLIAGILSEEAYVTLQLWTVAAFIGGATAERFSPSWKRSTKSSSGAPEPLNLRSGE